VLTNVLSQKSVPKFGWKFRNLSLTSKFSDNVCKASVFVIGIKKQNDS